MESPEISREEIERLINLKNRFVAEQFNFHSTIFIATAGFCLATLSASNIPDFFNFGLTLITLSAFLIVLLRGKFKDSPLYNFQSQLREKYARSEETTSFINEHDPWKGFQREKRTLWGGVLISVLFVIYTAMNHLIGIIS